MWPLDVSFAHEEFHKNAVKNSASTGLATIDQNKLNSQLQKINEAYIQSVKPIFKRSCFDCHSSNTQYPWYSSIPGIKQLIEEDIREAREHMDMTNDFPFSGHGDPEKNLEEIQEEIEEGEMPLWSYKLLHWKARLSTDEEKEIIRWAKESLEMLKSLGAKTESK